MCQVAQCFARASGLVTHGSQQPVQLGDYRRNLGRSRHLYTVGFAALQSAHIGPQYLQGLELSSDDVILQQQQNCQYQGRYRTIEPLELA
jgi:hypothetical protein